MLAPALDLTMDPVALTAALVDMPSVSGDEAPLADLVEAALAALPHLPVVRVGNNVIARTELGRERRVLLAGHLDTVPVSATKSQTGHLLGASGAIESVLSVLAVYHGQAPVTINLENQDPEIPLDVVTGSPRQLPKGQRVAVNNSFGFGGHNAVSVFRSM